MAPVQQNGRPVLRRVPALLWLGESVRETCSCVGQSGMVATLPHVAASQPPWRPPPATAGQRGGGGGRMEMGQWVRGRTARSVFRGIHPIETVGRDSRAPNQHRR